MANGYMTRAMRSSDPRYARVLEKLGYARPAEAASAPPPAPEPEKNEDDTANLRAEYERVLGKRPFMGWGAEALREKIAEYRRRDMRAED